MIMYNGQISPQYLPPFVKPAELDEVRSQVSRLDAEITRLREAMAEHNVIRRERNNLRGRINTARRAMEAHQAEVGAREARRAAGNNDPRPVNAPTAAAAPRRRKTRKNYRY
jgi:chromosome segregation ATPase